MSPEWWTRDDLRRGTDGRLIFAGHDVAALAAEHDRPLFLYNGARIRANADRLGVDRLRVIEGQAPGALEGFAAPQAVFIGGGLGDALLTDLTERLSPGTRLVAHAVTLESEAVLAAWSERLGGSLLRVELSEAGALGARRGWKAAYPVVQWRVVL